jgi:hypothetical protein
LIQTSHYVIHVVFSYIDIVAYKSNIYLSGLLALTTEFLDLPHMFLRYSRDNGYLSLNLCLLNK